jgi:peptidoglycan/xylan/chitin deacetylase (PgdA/CDA1 family)
MLTIVFPDNCRAECHWIGAIVLGEFLGLAHEIRFGGENKVRITAAGNHLELPDIFFARSKDKWLCSASLPEEPLRRWTVAESGLAAKLVEPSLPLLYGCGGFEVRDRRQATLDLDIFGAAFFMLSRYEEAVSEQRDEHDRFPAHASLAYRNGFLGRPIIDEYVEVLWAAMLRVWPHLERKARRFRSLVTCDVDHPYHPSAASFPRLIRRTAGEALRKRSVPHTINPIRNYFASRKGNWTIDPYYHMVDWIMGVNERAGNTVAFYFIPEVTDVVMDDTCSLDDPAVIAMMKRISQRGHEIGIHPGYHAYQSEQHILSGKRRLQHVMDQQRIPQRVAGGRQHYLRWSTRTPALWDAARLEYDSTLGYADHAGFRCGTCHEYPMFDLHSRRALDVRQRPLICMESSVIAYMGFGYTQAALAKMKELKSAAQIFDGDFTLLWHNSYFEAPGAKEMYCEILA